MEFGWKVVIVVNSIAIAWCIINTYIDIHIYESVIDMLEQIKKDRFL